MTKKKFDLTSNMINIDQPPSHESETKRVTVTVMVDLNYRSQIKTWCVQHNMTVQEAFKCAFDQLML